MADYSGVAIYSVTIFCVGWFSGDGGLQVLHRREKCVFIFTYKIDEKNIP